MKKAQALVAAGILLSIPSPAHSQAKPSSPTTPKPAASVEGHVICSDGNAPARGAVVHLHSLA
ncbi:MAG TPA: hypothetical protein VL346_04595, partial [Acidobacteriaceae bacterium]|nr:hypothetical protein [Acidobacteriaceae bacterium]